MFQCTKIFFSKALHNSTPFVEGALQLMKLHLAHKNASQDGNKNACLAIEKEFYKEVESFRPCFTLSASLDVAQKYSKGIYTSLCYFGMRDDPLIRQMDPIIGKAGMRAASRSAAAAPFKGGRGSSIRFQGDQTSNLTGLEEQEVTTLPEELPNPPKVDLTDPSRRQGAVKVPLRYRGHWVLQEPEIAITKAERREDPW